MFISLVLHAIIIVTIAPTLADDKDFHDVTHHFRMTIPEGWAEIQSSLITKMNEDVVKRKIQNVKFSQGFQPKSQNGITYPYILIQPLDAWPSRPTYEQIEKYFGLAASTEAEDVKKKLSDVLRGVNVGKGVLDQKRNRFVMTVNLEGPGWHQDQRNYLWLSQQESNH